MTIIENVQYEWKFRYAIDEAITLEVGLRLRTIRTLLSMEFRPGQTGSLGLAFLRVHVALRPRPCGRGRSSRTTLCGSAAAAGGGRGIRI